MAPDESQSSPWQQLPELISLAGVAKSNPLGRCEEKYEVRVPLDSLPIISSQRNFRRSFGNYSTPKKLAILC